MYLLLDTPPTTESDLTITDSVDNFFIVFSIFFIRIFETQN